VEAPDRLILPEIENAPVKVTVTAACNRLLVGTSPPSANQPNVVTMRFNLTGQVVLTGPAAISLDSSECTTPGTATVTKEQDYQATFSRTAPAFVPVRILASAHLEGSGLPTDEPDPEVEFVVASDYYSNNQVKLASKLQQCAPGGQADYEVEITNFGNARTQYTFEVASKPGGEWSIDLPEPVVLERPTSTDGTSTRVMLMVTCTGLNSEGAFMVVVTPVSADDPSKEGNPLMMNLLARSRGAVPVPIPDLGPLLPLALLGAALVLARRRP
jgi:uncharacterized protein (TIGR03382 family)